MDPLMPQDSDQLLRLLLELLRDDSLHVTAAVLFARLRLLDTFGLAQKTFEKAKERLGGAKMHAMDPGLVNLLFRITSTVDDDRYRDYWVNLIHAGLSGDLDHSKVRWAAMQLERLVPADALALAMCMDPIPHHKKVGLSGAMGDLDESFQRLAVLGLVEEENHEDDARIAGAFDSLYPGVAVAGQEGVITKITTLTGPGTTRQATRVMERWRPTYLGRRLSVFADIKALPSYGPFDDAVEVMNDEWFAKQ